MDKTAQSAVNAQVKMLTTTAQDLLDANAQADRMIQEAIDFGAKHGYDMDPKPTTSGAVDALIAADKKKKAKVAGLYEIDEGRNSDGDDDFEEEKDFVPAMIPAGRRRDQKEASLDAEREEIE